MEKDLYLHNTLGRKKETFVPIEEGKVRFYHCGPTVYWVQHIGNMRGMTMADLVRRTFEYYDYKVSMVRNYTDVGHLTGDSDEGVDKMAKGVAREGLTPEEIAAKYIKRFDDDVEALNQISPEYRPRATEFISQMIDAVQILIDKGYAYVTPDAVYFDVSKAADYTKLSGQSLDEQEGGAGKGDVTDPNKRNSRDFSVWFFKTGVHEKALQYWKSPFNSPKVSDGEGFPGWHLECSVMSNSLLGETIDVHMGGIEHIPVHHTNEIAQSEAISGKKFVNYWLHNEHLLVNNGKMSKSEGTSYSLADIVEKGFDPLDLRYLFLTAHYRSKQNFTWDSLESAKSARERLNSIIRNLQRENSSAELKINEEWKEKFLDALADDIGVPAALAVTWDLLKSEIPVAEKLGTIFDFDRVLGLSLKQAVESSFMQVNDEEIQRMIKERNDAKEKKDYALSDKIRSELLAQGVILEDTADGTVWKIK